MADTVLYRPICNYVGLNHDDILMQYHYRFGRFHIGDISAITADILKIVLVSAITAKIYKKKRDREHDLLHGAAIGRVVLVLCFGLCSVCP